jgi:SRSO17 transposase
MRIKPRVAQAPREPMPELAQFLGPFRVHFAQAPSAGVLDRYVTGLLTEHPNKNCQTLAGVVPGITDQRLNNLLTDMAWDETDLNRQRVQRMAGLPTEGDGVLVFDDTGFGKQGRHSVGVARQYSGTLGRVGNCQVTVNCHYAERTVAWPVNTRLYLPQSWAEDEARRARARVPPELRFQTKPEIALELLDQANAWGVRHAAVTADADYGDSPHFLDGLEARGEPYVVAVRKNFSVALRARGGPAEPAEAVLAQVGRRAWRSLAWREGSQGWLRARFAAVRCWRVDGRCRRRIGWLIGQRPGRNQQGEFKYFWSNFGPHAALSELVEYAHRRHWVEQYHEEAKGVLGWDQFQGRRWDGFHRHAVTVMLSYSFLVWLEWRQRQQQKRRGRPRGAFSPSARRAPPVLAGGASGGGRLAQSRRPAQARPAARGGKTPGPPALTK